MAPRSARRVATTVSVTRSVCSAIREPGVRSRSLVTKRIRQVPQSCPETRRQNNSFDEYLLEPPGSILDPSTDDFSCFSAITRKKKNYINKFKIQGIPPAFMRKFMHIPRLDSVSVSATISVQTRKMHLQDCQPATSQPASQI